MDIKRNLLIIALAVVSYLLLLQWNKDYPAQANAEPPAATQLPDIVATETNDLPQIPAVEQGQNPVATIDTSPTLITVTTPAQIVTIDPQGGDIVKLALPQFPSAIDRQNDPFVLLDNSVALNYVAQSGLIGTNGADGNTSGRPRYRSTQEQYQLTAGELNVDLVFTDSSGIEIIKRFIFTADDYLIRIQYLIDNKTTASWRGNLFGQIKRSNAPDPSTGGGFGINTYLGAVMNTQDDPYIRQDFEDIEDGTESFSMPGGWIGFSQHYFLGSWIPAADTINTYSTRRNSAGEYLMGFVGPEVQVPPGQSASIDTSFWAGPKDQYRLEEIAPDLGLTIDYGKLWFVAYPIFWLLTKINEQAGNYGISIVLLTLVIRLLLYPLSIKQFRSQANMKRLQPKLAQLKERYGDDKQKFMQAQMELWKKENVNPFSGCLPPLLQMPVFLGIYWVLNESVELRQAPFILWYNDLSVLDPYFVLPLLLGAAYFLQQHMTPMMTTDPTQEKIMKFMPIMFTVFFLWFPAGLVLYYLANALIGLLQQWLFILRSEKASVPAKE